MTPNVLNPQRLNVGCGRKIMSGYINLDMVIGPGVDVVANLEKPPLPFDDNIFDKIHAEDVLEHVNDIVAVVEELGRILKVGGTLWVRGPHAKYPENCWRDPTHRRMFVETSMDNWDPSTYEGSNYGHYFGKYKFKVLERKEVNLGMEFLLQKR